MLQVLLSGLSVGAIYGLVAMAFAIVFYVTKVINFATGQLLMVSILLAAGSIKLGLPDWLGIVIGLSAATVLGVLIYFIAVRPVLKFERAGFAWLVSTLGVAIVIQSTWSCILAMTGSYETLLNYVVFADWIFFGLTVAAVVVFRRTHPLETRPEGAYRSPGYPFVQIFFVLVAAAVVLSVVRDDPSSAFRGALLLAAGIPVFYWFSRRRTP